MANLRKKLRLRARRFSRRFLPERPVRPRLLRAGREEIWASAPIDPARLRVEGRDAPSDASQLGSALCRAEMLESAAFRHWADRLGERFLYDRKLWEFCYITQALFERGMLAPGRRGLGFAVGRERLPAFFASFGCELVATDLGHGDERAKIWEETQQWVADLEALNQHGLCDPELFRKNVTFRPVDMNDIPSDLRDFDFNWSACAFEHCGSIEAGKRFVLRQMDTLRPGGIAVHTTEFNLGSNFGTLDSGATVLFRRRDLVWMMRELRRQGHEVMPLDLTLGAHPYDSVVDREPFRPEPHLRIQVSRWPTTSLGIIVRKRSV